MSIPDTRELTTTSYAILGMLAIRPWSTYALTQQMRRSLRHIWPRAESNVYAEPKRLVDAGLVTAAVERTGKRARTVYTITPEGREALRRWLETACAPSRFESETMVKVLFSPSGSKEALLSNLRDFAAEANTERAFWQAVGEEYLRGAGRFPERIHVNALIFRWIWEQAETKTRWAEWAIAEVESWPDTVEPADVARSLKTFREAIEASHHSLPGGSPSPIAI
jgi:PadR family transcriptional regulator AphA